MKLRFLLFLLSSSMFSIKILCSDPAQKPVQEMSFHEISQDIIRAAKARKAEHDEKQKLEVEEERLRSEALRIAAN